MEGEQFRPVYYCISISMCQSTFGVHCQVPELVWECLAPPNVKFFNVVSVEKED